MSPLSQRDLRRLGAIVVVGLVAGAGVRYYVESRARKGTSQPRMVDWDQARRIALGIVQSDTMPVTDRAARQAQYERLVQQSEPLIAEYLGVKLPAPIKRVHVFDRKEWLEANFISFEQMFEPIEAIYQRSGGLSVAFKGLVGALNSRLMGTGIGTLLGFLGQRVLGQYDLSLLSPDPAAQGALYFVEPNIGRLQRMLNLSDEEFRLWIALHETTHVFEFEAYPWVRGYFKGLIQEYFDQVVTNREQLADGLTRILAQVRERPLDVQHWLETLMTAEQRELFERIQAVMSLVEGYGNHVMNAVGRKLLPSFDHIEQRFAERQRNRSLLDQLFNRLTGMDMKLAQYQLGEAFVNTVVEIRGIAFANRVWERAEHLPTLAEIRDPQRWIARIERGSSLN